METRKKTTKTIFIEILINAAIMIAFWLFIARKITGINNLEMIVFLIIVEYIVDKFTSAFVYYLTKNIRM